MPSDSTTIEPDHLLARIWAALRDVQDPEIPVSVVDMGLIVSVSYDAARRTACLAVTFTAMGCPAMAMIEDDIKQRLLREPGIDDVETCVVWEPQWTPRLLSQRARATMFELGIAT